MLRDTFELAENALSKNPIISMVCSKKILEFLLRYRILGLRAMLLLMPLLDYCLAEKRGGKKDSIWPISPGNFEIVFTLLAKTIN